MSVLVRALLVTMLVLAGACTRCAPAPDPVALAADAGAKLGAVRFPVNGRSPWQPAGIVGLPSSLPTPHQHFGSSLLFEFNPGLVATQSSLLTVSGGNIVQARDAAGGSLVFANASGAGYGTASPLNGRAYLAGGTAISLYSATGGVTGASPHTIWAIVRWNASGGGFCSIAQMGSAGSGNSVIGAHQTTGEVWGGGAGDVYPYGPQATETLYSGASGTTYPMVMLLVGGYDGTNKSLYVDGRLAVVGTFGNPYGNTYSTDATFGFTGWGGGGTCGTADVFDAGWTNTAPTVADLTYLTNYTKSLLGTSYPQTQAVVRWEGDSIVLGIGYGADPGDDTPHVVQGLLTPATGVSVGAAGGSTLTQIAARGYESDQDYSARRRQNLYFQAGCYNDISTSGWTSAQWIAAEEPILTARQATGYTTILGTCTPALNFNGAQETTRLAINTWITGPAISGKYVVAASNRDSDYAFLFANPPQTNAPHFNDSGYGCNQPNGIACVDTPVIQALLH